MASPKKGFLAFFLAVVSVAGIVALSYLQNPFFEAFEAKTYDLRFKVLRGPIKADPNIAIIAIDEKSIKDLGRFPWSRSSYVQLIDQVSAAGAKALIMDAFFPEPETFDVDGEFAKAMARAKNVILAVSFEFNSDWSIKSLIRSIPELSQAAAGEAHMNFIPDEDGVNRRNLLVVEYQGKKYPSLGLKGAMSALGATSFKVTPFEIICGDRRIPINDNAMWINHTGPPGSYKKYSFSDVAQGKIPPEELKGKILFMGATALGIYDMRVTPYHSNTPGVEIHATIADNIINRHFIRQTGIEAMIDIGAICLLGLLTFWVTLRMKMYTAFPVLLIITGGYGWGAYYMFEQGYWLSVIYPLVGIWCSYVVAATFKYIVLSRSAKYMRSIFSSYVSSKIVDQLAEDPSAAKIGGATKLVTILFSDIQGFTTYSEKNDPYTVVTTLNEYLATMTRIIMKYDGTVDKFLGDGIMAYWGAPLPQEDHAELAMACTVAMQFALKKLQAKWKKAGKPILSFRVGIHTGEVIAGNIGASGKKMEYTIIGDNVNLASRLEGTAKFYGVKLLVSESTYKLAQNKFVYRELDKIRVVGKKIPVTIYELMGSISHPDSIKNQEIADKFGEALRLYRNREWDKALQIFKMFTDVNADDVAATIYVKRCLFFAKNPPPADWDGVFVRTKK